MKPSWKPFRPLNFKCPTEINRTFHQWIGACSPMGIDFNKIGRKGPQSHFPSEFWLENILFHTIFLSGPISSASMAYFACRRGTSSHGRADALSSIVLFLTGSSNVQPGNMDCQHHYMVCLMAVFIHCNLLLHALLGFWIPSWQAGLSTRHELSDWTGRMHR